MLSMHARPTNEESAARIWMGASYEGSEVQKRIEARKPRPIRGHTGRVKFGKKKPRG